MGTKKPFMEDGSMDGGIAAWYFDGSEMHDQILLGRARIRMGESGITTASPDTAFLLEEGSFRIVIGDAMEFRATMLDDAHHFNSPWEKGHRYLGYGYDMTGINRLKLTALVDGEASEGSCYFQKVALGAPAVPWYWGIFHFDGEASLSYYNPHVLGRALKKDVSLYDGTDLHRFNDIAVSKTGDGNLPVYDVRAENKEESIELTVETYAKTVWRFRKRKLGFIPVQFNYAQFPSRITRLKLKDKRDGSLLSEEDIGIGVGNAEDSTGILL
jgi:hypothetical protein